MSHSTQPVRGAHGSTRNVAGSAIMRKSPPPSISAMPKPPPGVKTGNAVLCGVLGKQRGGHGAAVAHDRGRLVCHDGLSAQDAVLVGKREAHDLKPVFLDPLVGFDGGFELFVVPQSVALDEAVRSSLLR